MAATNYFAEMVKQAYAKSSHCAGSSGTSRFIAIDPPGSGGHFGRPWPVHGSMQTWPSRPSVRMTGDPYGASSDSITRAYEPSLELQVLDVRA